VSQPGAGAGRFIAVVGPSGAGKDTLIDFARQLLAGDERFVFARRVVTRPADTGSEAHDSLTAAEFEAALAAGAFGLDWSAHGLRYGLPIGLDDDIAAGRTVVANLSRRVLPEMERRYARHLTVVVTARPEIIAARLAARGRETIAEIEGRLRRRTAEPTGPQVTSIDNSAAPEIAGTRFMALLLGELAPVQMAWGSKDSCLFQ
jgi:ribose 1,5-bisphosphokinase